MIRKCYPCQQLQLTNQCPLCNKPTEEINSLESVITHHLLTILDKLDVTYFIQETVLFASANSVDLIEIQIENRVGNYAARLYVNGDIISIYAIVVTTFTTDNAEIKTETPVGAIGAIRISLADPNCFQQFQTAISKLL